MKRLPLISVLLIVACNSSQKASVQKDNSRSFKYPVMISYKGQNPPDSISTFFKTCLQLKGFEIIDYIEMISRWKQSAKNTLHSETNQDLQSIFNASQDKVGNLLTIYMFAHTDLTEKYTIDSLKWRAFDFPVKDTSMPYKTFSIPQTMKENNSLILKSFADFIISSKALF